MWNQQATQPLDSRDQGEAEGLQREVRLLFETWSSVQEEALAAEALGSPGEA